MKRISILFILTVTIRFNYVIAQEHTKQRIDFSGVNAFWSIADKITNQQVTEADWDNLFSTGYYKFYEN